MDELIARIAQAAGIEADAAKLAIGTVLNFIREEAPTEAEALLNSLPGAEEATALAQAAADSGRPSGIFSTLLGGTGGVMALGSTLMAQGLSFSQIETIARELLDHGRTHLGNEGIARLAVAIPSLSNFV